MKISDVLTEAVPVSAPSNVGRDYINMLNFVKGSGLEGVPADQQVAVALFKELQKQQQKNTKLGQELSAAERRIDQATQSGDMYGQELATHQAELDRERGEIDKQREKMGQIDRQYADRAQASEQQMRSLTDQLTLGSNSANRYFNGYMSSVRVTKSALYTSGFTAPSAPLPNIANTSLLLQVNSAGTYLADSSNNNFTMTNSGVIYSTLHP